MRKKPVRLAKKEEIPLWDKEYKLFFLLLLFKCIFWKEQTLKLRLISL